MRLTKLLLPGVAALALSTGAAFAGGDSMSESSMSQDLMPQEFDAQPEVYDVYIIPADEVVVIPFEPSEAPIAGNELG